ncbi:chromophore lyase CpcT/CpeT [Aquimarina sp. W85]|uniref:chromophore lyase CpcT/CpeT n=1 Tax=Aquimarina rhodophyticola TaxID=3342246 RepID=UPI00366EA9E6
MSKKINLSVLFLAVCTSCISPKSSDIELQKFSSLFIGSFSTQEQALNDSSYRSINLEVHPIWENKSGHWMFAEWVENNDTSKIIQRRIIQLKRLDSANIISKLYKLPVASEKLNSEQIVTHIDNNYDEEHLLLRHGCDINYTKQTSNIYVGKTNPSSCKSQASGIAYITSQIIISTNRFTEWTRGFDTKGKQVWGKIKGPYQYKRIQD